MTDWILWIVAIIAIQSLILTFFILIRNLEKREGLIVEEIRRLRARIDMIEEELPDEKTK